MMVNEFSNQSWNYQVPARNYCVVMHASSLAMRVRSGLFWLNLVDYAHLRLTYLTKSLPFYLCGERPFNYKFLFICSELA